MNIFVKKLFKNFYVVQLKKTERAYSTNTYSWKIKTKNDFL